MTRDFTTLSIDLGSTFGWALGKNGTVTHSGEIALSHKDAHPGNRFLRFHEFLSNFRSVNEVLYEDVPRFESAASARVYCGMLAMLQVFCLVQGIRMSSMKSNSVKKAFTTNGNCSKTMMCEMAHKLGWRGGKLGTDIEHNACDAIALLWVVYTKRGVEPKFERLDTQKQMSL